MSIIGAIFGDPAKNFQKKSQGVIDAVNGLEKEIESFSSQVLREEFLKLRNSYQETDSLDDLLPRAFALVREAAKRTLGQRHFDVQLLGSLALHQGRIIEMRTGEGKTLTATLAVALNALSGKGVHVVTVNDHLARRDVVWMGQIYNLLGLSVGCITHEESYLYDAKHQGEVQNSKIKIQNDNLNLKSDEVDQERDLLGSFQIFHEFLRPCSRKEAYAADITYGTNNEFGFDYLRDNMAFSEAQMAQRGHNFAIVDEVDSILIDEARTPLIISAPDEESGELYKVFAKVVTRLEADKDFTKDEKHRAVSVTEDGIEKVERILGVPNIYDPQKIRYVRHLEQALRAEVLFKKDRDYVVRNGEVIIVDEFTGRLMPGRRWSEGLHQAVEAKEGVKVERESRTLATITFQNYFRKYKKLAGMTGTAFTSAEEFHKVYKLEVVVIPTAKLMIRQDLPDLVYATEKGKLQALVREIRTRHEKGQPLLVGTRSIERNELLGALLRKEGIKHEVLNAKNHEHEAMIIAQAGRLGVVTVATNMAGRGIDILLGGNPPDSIEREKVLSAGGLHVIGTERHEARRIDNQLRGRAGRQGDPGSSQFFVSSEDELMRIFGSDRLKNIMQTFGVKEDESIESGLVSKAIEAAQSKIEGMNFDVRKHVLEYDDVMNSQREAVYSLRHSFMSSEKVSELIEVMLEKEIDRMAEFYALDSSEERDKNFGEAIAGFLGAFSLEWLNGSIEQVTQALRSEAKRVFEAKAKDLGDQASQAFKQILLQTIDFLWISHLETMEYLRDSVRLRAYGQRDPLVEYKREAQRLFKELQSAIQSLAVQSVLKIQSQSNRESVRQAQSIPAQVLAPQVLSAEPKKKPRPNDPCWCGSGKKFKKCHGK